MKSRCIAAFLLFVLLGPLLFFLGPRAGAEMSADDHSVQLFLQAAKVFRHPRCLNCHPAGDRPTQGNDFHPHIMGVLRGSDDHGFVAMRCQGCHGTENYLSQPGAPQWALAPRSMAWQGLSDGELCRALKDPQKTRRENLQLLVEHNAKDPLVGWAWHPGPGLEPAPGTQEDFGKIVAEWVATGAHCPN